jgi:hypothetical protein
MYSKRKPPRPKQHGAAFNKANARSGRIKADSLSDRAFEAKNRAFHTVTRISAFGGAQKMFHAEHKCCFTAVKQHIGVQSLRS